MKPELRPVTEDSVLCFKLHNHLAPSVPPSAETIVKATVGGDHGRYQELIVTAWSAGSGRQVADIVIGVDTSGELRVLVSAAGNPDEHAWTIFPERALDADSVFNLGNAGGSPRSVAERRKSI